jgi:glycosyl transferase, family 25
MRLYRRRPGWSRSHFERRSQTGHGMKVYFINLDRSPERLEWFLKQTGGMDLDLVRVPAVDAKELPDTELDRLRALSSGRNSLSAGELGCFLSHRKAWEMVVADNAPWAFIAEDDIHFSRNAASFLRSHDWIPAGADMIKGEATLKQVEMGNKVEATPFGHELRRLISYHFCAGGYFLTPQAAQLLLSVTERHCEPVDEIIFSPQYGILGELLALQLTPAICMQDNFVSSPSTDEKMVSTLEADRVHFHRFDPTSPRLHGWRKIPRELGRIGRQTLGYLRRVVLLMTSRIVFEKVPFDPR